MTMREKVIKGLECCALTGLCHDKGCPYIDSETCVDDLCNDALALIKPRVMTLEEARNALHNEIVVLWEAKSDELSGLFCGMRMNVTSYFTMQNDDILGVTDLDNVEYSEAYGKLFRAWTSKPTDAQMKETPW